MHTALTIAGSDSSGGAGIQADLKTMTAFHVYGMSVITAVTAQNTCGVNDSLVLPASIVSAQLEAVCCDIRPDAIKIGMLGNGEVASAVAEILHSYSDIPLVIDPVFVSTSGKMLLDENGRNVLQNELFPLSTLITPNIPESEYLSGMSIHTTNDMVSVAKILYNKFHCNILLKGGHAADAADDLLYNGASVWFPGTRIECHNTHGTGCTLSSAIASGLATGKSLEESISTAKEYVRQAMSTGLDLGKGNGPLNHIL